MMLIPAMDLMDRTPVRLMQGDFDRRTDYASDAAQALENFRGAGAQMAHVVDLDGARAGEPRQHDFIATLTDILPLQVAGGFRSREQAGTLFDAGAARVVIGSLALARPQAFVEMLNCYGAERMVLALDIRMDGDRPLVATHGWQDDSGRSLDDVLADFPRVKHILVTDIGRDGMMAGPNVALYATLTQRYPGLAVQASGGVSSLADITALTRSGVAACIIGKAIWEGRFTIDEGIAHAGG